MKRKMMSLLLVLSLLLVAVPAGAETTMTGEETAAAVQAMLAAINPDAYISTVQSAGCAMNTGDGTVRLRLSFAGIQTDEMPEGIRLLRGLISPYCP